MYVIIPLVVLSVIALSVIVILVLRKKKEKYSYILSPQENGWYHISRKTDMVEKISGFQPNSSVQVMFKSDAILTLEMPVDKNGDMYWNGSSDFSTSLPMFAIVTAEVLVKGTQKGELVAYGVNVPTELRLYSDIIHFPVNTTEGQKILSILPGQSVTLN